MIAIYAYDKKYFPLISQYYKFKGKLNPTQNFQRQRQTKQLEIPFTTLTTEFQFVRWNTNAN